MKGDPKVIEYLNQALKNELTAINQYFLHARMFQDWGLEALNSAVKAESIEEMHHADWLIQRILFLDGMPNLQDLGRLRIGEDTQEILRGDLALEEEAVTLLREAIAHCESVSDYVTRDLLDRILASEENHIDWISTQLDLIEKVGLQNYLQSQMANAEE
jgi:bacterioferritin